jgi:hypothetical protein
VVCGHIHQPEMKEIRNQKGKTMYLNSGDWVENLTALEYQNNAWSLYEYAKDPLVKALIESKPTEKKLLKKKQKENDFIIDELLKEFAIQASKR